MSPQSKVSLNCICFLILITLLSNLVTIPNRAFGQEAKNFNVGVIIPLTGDLADYGSSIQRGFDLATSGAPQRFSNVHFVFEDSKYDGNAALTALQKLKTTDHINLYYAWGVSPTEAIIPITEAEKLPLLVETTLKESTTKKAYVVRAARTGERIAQALAAELTKRKLNSVSLIVTEIPFYDDILRHLKTLLRKNGISITRAEKILPSENNLRPYTLKLSRQSDDAIGVFLLPAQITSFYKNIAQLKFSVKTFSADIIGSDSIIKDCPDNINGTFFTEVGITPEFRKLYTAKYGNDGHIGHAAQAYDIANLVSDLFGNLTQKLSPDDIMQRIAQIPPRKGATGEFRYLDTLDGGKEIRVPVAMKEIRNRTIETISEDAGV
jgi:ABC-type branched-subunit amino acid transport system substrate-binding protein